jgi:hypothetical protein
MLIKLALVLLVAWVLGIVGVYQMGDLVHLLLLAALMILLLGIARARDAAMAKERQEVVSTEDSRRTPAKRA